MHSDIWRIGGEHLFVFEGGAPWAILVFGLELLNQRFGSAHCEAQVLLQSTVSLYCLILDLVNDRIQVMLQFVV